MGGKGRNGRICEICGVRESHRGGFFANFPKDESRCRNWVKIVGKEDLVHLPIEKLHEVRHVCGDHFEAKYFNKKRNRLKKKAFPKLNLSAPPLTDEQMIEFPQHMASKKVVVPMEPEPQTSRSVHTVTSSIMQSANVAEHSYCLQPVAEHPSITQSVNVVVPMEPEPQTSRSVHTVTSSITQSANVAEHSYCLQPLAEHPSITQSVSVVVPMEPEPQTSRSVHTVTSSIMQSANVAEHSYCLQPVAEHPSITQSVNVVVPMEPEPQTSRSVTSSITQSANETTPKKTELRKIPIERKGKSVKRKLEESIDVTPRKKKLIAQLQKTKCTLASLKKSAKLVESIESPMLKTLVLDAIKNQKRKSRGQRWTTKNKISALAIFKRSAKAYRYLKNIIPLPSVKTLQNVLRKIPINTFLI